jgi:hypothetical protein
MGNRATCPVCGFHSSDVLNDIENGKDCRICGLKNNLLGEYQDILTRKELYKKNLISQELIEENDALIKENFKLKSKNEKLVHIFGDEFDCPIMDIIKNVLHIIHDKENIP